MNNSEAGCLYWGSGEKEKVRGEVLTTLKLEETTA